MAEHCEPLQGSTWLSSQVVGTKADLKRLTAPGWYAEGSKSIVRERGKDGTGEGEDRVKDHTYYYFVTQPLASNY